MRYVISYDLRNPGQDYQTLYDALAAIGAKRVLQSQWCARRNNTTAKGLRDHFRQYMDSNDRILVTSIDSANWSGWNLINKISEM